jgi:hypothetical protein
MKLPVTQTLDSDFIWAESQNPGQYRDFRVPGPGDMARLTEEISKEETANAILCALAETQSLPAAEATENVASLFDVQITARSAKNHFQAGIDYGISQGLLKRTGDSILRA